MEANEQYYDQKKCISMDSTLLYRPESVYLYCLSDFYDFKVHF